MSNLNPADLPALEQAILRIIIRRGRVSLSALEKLVEGAPDEGPTEHSRSVRAAGDRLANAHWLDAQSRGDEVIYAQRAPRSSVTETGAFKPGDFFTAEKLRAALDTESKVEHQTPAPGQVVFWMVALNLINAFVLGILDVVAISSFIGELGTRSLPLLWIGEMVIGLIVTSSLLPVIDRLPRLISMRRFLGILVFIYIAIVALFLVGVPTKFLAPLLYLLYSDQFLIFSAIYWSLSNDLFTMAQTKRLFPILTSGDTSGRVLGYAIFSLPALLGFTAFADSISSNPAILVGISAVLFVLGLVHSLIVFRGAKLDVARTDTMQRSLRENLAEGFEMIREVPLFRYLSVSGVLMWTCLMILWFQFYLTLDEAAAQGANFSTLYSTFAIAVLFTPLVLQWTVTRRLLQRVPARDAILVLPIAILLSVTTIIGFPGILTSVLGLFVIVVVQVSWDFSVTQSFQNLIPDERRGRVGAILSNYPYALGMILGSASVGTLILLQPSLGFSDPQLRAFALTLAMIAAVAGVTSMLWARATYEDSLFSWRIRRRQRARDLLDKIDL